MCCSTSAAALPWRGSAPRRTRRRPPSTPSCWPRGWRYGLCLIWLEESLNIINLFFSANNKSFFANRRPRRSARNRSPRGAAFLHWGRPHPSPSPARSEINESNKVLFHWSFPLSLFFFCFVIGQILMENLTRILQVLLPFIIRLFSIVPICNSSQILLRLLISSSKKVVQQVTQWIRENVWGLSVACAPELAGPGGWLLDSLGSG